MSVASTDRSTADLLQEVRLGLLRRLGLLPLSAGLAVHHRAVGVLDLVPGALRRASRVGVAGVRVGLDAGFGGTGGYTVLGGRLVDGVAQLALAGDGRGVPRAVGGVGGVGGAGCQGQSAPQDGHGGEEADSRHRLAGHDQLRLQSTRGASARRPRRTSPLSSG